MRRTRYLPLALLLPVSTAAWLGSACRPAAPPSRPGTVAVLRPTVEPASAGWMGAPLAEETERALSAAGITVLPIGSSADYRLITTLTLGDRLAVRNRLVDSRDSSRVIDLVYDIPSESLGSLTDRIASVVLTGLGRPQRPFAIPTQTPAYLTYLRALSYRRSANPADVRWAAELFRQVIAADSGFSPAWHGLAGALQAIAVAEGRRSPGLETEWREAVRRSAGLDSVAAVGRRPVVAGAEGREPH